MEHFTLVFPSRPAPPQALQAAAALCGVVGSGNLEVLVEPGGASAAQDCCQLEVHTAAEGFRETWQAVLGEFCALHAAGGLSLLLNDVGATPAVVALRLAQAYEAWLAGPAAGAP
ncbi:MAG: malonate decarboxylase acyl carrier protein [Pseudomonadota bacterium]|nr:malonate decarboxylase acyl carrier protein [Pseudomonadota bacterium]